MKIIFVTIVLLIALIPIGVVIYTFYMTWFRPSDYLKQSSKMIGDSWPFADYYRSVYASSTYLWTMRLGSLFFGLVIGFLIVITLLHFLGLGF